MPEWDALTRVAETTLNPILRSDVAATLDVRSALTSTPCCPRWR